MCKKYTVAALAAVAYGMAVVNTLPSVTLDGAVGTTRKKEQGVQLDCEVATTSTSYFSGTSSIA